MFKGIKVAALAATALLTTSLLNGPMLAIADTFPHTPQLKQSATMTGYQMIKGSVNNLVVSGLAKNLGSLDPNKTLHLAFVLKPRQISKLEALAQAKGAALSASQYKKEFQPADDTVVTVKKFVSDQQLQVVRQTPGLMIVEGTTTQIQKALHIKMNRYQAKNRSFYSTSTDPVVPTDVASSILGIVGLSEVTYSEKPIKHAATTAGGNGFFTPDAIRTAYGLIPAYGNHIDGTGRNIAILIGGDYDDSAVEKFSQTFGIPYNANQIRRVIVPNTEQAPAGPEDESTLDVEWSHAIAPGATITEYETGDLNEVDLVNGFEQILESDTPPDAVNMSFGASEEFMSNMDIGIWHALFAEAVAKGITPVAASGDSGAYDPGTGFVSVNHPASDPLVLAVGGTSLTVDQNNVRTAETAWGYPLSTYGFEGSGGGHSKVFTDSQGNSRAVPDVSMVAENLEYNMGGTLGWAIADGTSFAAPMWSGLLALAAQKGNKSMGWVNPAIKNIATNKTTAGVFRDITTGTDGLDIAKSGFDAVTGWGTPANGWSLVQALANAPTGTLSSAPNISGVVVGQSPYSTNQYAAYGVGTIDLLGSGFGNGSDGTEMVTLRGNGRTYNIPINDTAIGSNNWIDSEIVLNVDNLYEEGKAPLFKGTYWATVSSAGRVSNSFPITFADFLNIVGPDQPTTISPNSSVSKTFQMLQVTAYTPAGYPDTSFNGIGNFYFTQTYSTPNANIAVKQNAGLITPVNGLYKIQFYHGVATVQVATDTAIPAQQEAYVVTANGLIDGFLESPGFTAGTVAAISGPSEDKTYETTKSVLPVPVYAVDENGNFVPSNDNIRVTESGANGHVTINGSPINSEFDSTLSGMDMSDQTALEITDDTSESFTLTVQDTGNPSVKPYVQTLHFTSATQVAVHVENTNTPVLVQGQDPSYQMVQVTAQDSVGNAVPFDGPVYLKVDDGVDATPGINSIEQQMDATTWQPLQDLSNGLYKLDLSQTGSTVVRVTSSKLESLRYDFSIKYGDGNTAEGVDSGVFVPAGQEHFSPLVLFPHMPTSSFDSPEYDEVRILGSDVNNNLFLSSSQQATLQEAPGGPDVVLATQASDGSLQPVQNTGNGWTVNLNSADVTELYAMSSQPGIAQFTVTDPDNSQIGSGMFQIDFVNSMPTNLQVNEPVPVNMGSDQTVAAQVVDANRQPVVNATDSVALNVIKPAGALTVTDIMGKRLTPVQGQYLTNSVAGVATFHVKDTKAETLQYTLTDRTQPLETTVVNGTFLTPTVAPLASNISVTNNQSGTPDTVQVKGLTVGDVVNVYDTGAKNNLLGTSVVETGTTATISINQIGRVAGHIYVTVTNAGKGESTPTSIAYRGELSDLLTPDQIQVVNNLAKPDTVIVNGLNAGDVIKVYNSDQGGMPMARPVTVAAGHTTAVVTINQIGTLAGNLYVTVTSVGMQESNRTEKPFDPEPTATPSASNFSITNLLGNPDTVKVKGLTAGDIVKIYANSTSQVPLATSDPVATGNVSTALTIDQLGTKAGFVYATVTNVGKLESARVKIGYTAEPTPALSPEQATVSNNMGWTPDSVQVNSLEPGDVIKVYTASTGGRLIAAQTVATGQDSVKIACFLPSVTAGNVYVTVTSQGLLESARMQIAYPGEPTAALNGSQISVINAQGATDCVVVTGVIPGEVVNVYGSADPIDISPIASQTVGTGQSKVSCTNLDLVPTGGTLYVTVTRINQLESTRVGKSYGPEVTTM